MPEETKEEKLRRLLKKRTEAARKKIKLIDNLTGPPYKCEARKELMHKALSYLEDDIQGIKEKLESTKVVEDDFSVDL